MATGDVVVDGLWKTFRIYHQRSSTLKQAILRRGRDEYEEFWALRDVSFEVPAGMTFGLIGHNGAGKSTMLKVLSRILVPDKGSVRVDGRVSALLELGAGFHPELSGRENVYLNGTILGMSQAEVGRRFDQIVEFAGLEHAIDHSVKTYSSGMQARLGFAVAVSIEPDILIIDEVLAVGDEQFQRRCLERMSELRADGRTCIFVSHGLGQVQQICQQAVWLDHGTVAASGHTEDVVNAYLRSVSSNVWLDPEGRERMGTGEVRISVDVQDSTGSTTWVEAGRPVVLRVGWTCDLDSEPVIFEFRIHSAEGIVVAGGQFRSGPLKAGAGYVDYVIPRLDLLPGAYHISASAQHHESFRVYDHAHGLANFDVAPRESKDIAFGYLALNGQWSGASVG